MKVTRVKIDKCTQKETGVCASATVYLDDELAIHKIHICNGKKGFYITFPNTGELHVYNGNKRYDDIVHPVSNSLRVKISNAVLAAYQGYIDSLDSVESTEEVVAE